MAWQGSIRDGRPEEGADLEALQLRASVVYESDREAVLAHPEVVRLPPGVLEAGLVRVAEAGGEVLGFSVVVAGAEDEDAWELEGLFVEPGHWRGGIGSALIADVIARARLIGLRRVDVVANPNALGFYRAVGFEGEDVVATQFGPGIRATHRLA